MPAPEHRFPDVVEEVVEILRPVGGLEMHDEHGFDFKVLCVAVGDPNQAHIEALEQMRPHRLVEIEHFFDTYKRLEAKETDVVGWRDRDRAREVLAADRARHVREQGVRREPPPGQRRGTAHRSRTR